MDKKYLYYHLNYSPENKNEKAFAKYGNPGEKYGYPAFLILDKKGNILTTRKTEDMEENKGYNKEKVRKFLLGRFGLKRSTLTFIFKTKKYFISRLFSKLCTR